MGTAMHILKTTPDCFRRRGRADCVDHLAAILVPR
jgi:hypothetical protein